MTNNRKSKYTKYDYEKLGQIKLFGHDNLVFKSINLPRRQKFKNLCYDFKLKKFVNKNSLLIKFIEL